MRPMISNIGEAIYQVAKYLNLFLAPLGKSDRSFLNKKINKTH